MTLTGYSFFTCEVGMIIVGHILEFTKALREVIHMTSELSAQKKTLKCQLLLVFFF